MIRLATPLDARQLFLLNEEFNGKGVVTLDIIKERLENNKCEIIVVSEENGVVVGFVCAQVMISFCYSKTYAEITEVFVTKEHRRKGYASKMIEFIQDYCKENFCVENFQLFTGRNNRKAKRLYKSLGYRRDSATLMRKSK
ncbi:MAG: GNAT family N-acetyltransferase [Clostridia bacterium]|nr:GNAT family N-acetyltransferase [Clostridia bacterium]